MRSTEGTTTFGTIVAIFGSILIALGIAWLIAQNWHELAGWSKILILLLATCSAYCGGFFFRTHQSFGVGASLLMLGSLLYTLSIFLVAQIYSTSATWQGLAWLWFLAWVGVVVVSYLFDSKASLLVGLIEVCVWLVMQYLAFAEFSGYENQSVGILALAFLCMGVLVYGLSLVHRAWDHSFGSLYVVWTALYFLLFSYVLSFQSLLPVLWSEGAHLISTTLFVISLGVVALVVCFFGLLSCRSVTTVKRAEIFAVGGIVLFLAMLVSLAFFVASSVGTCAEKQCYEFSDQKTCDQSAITHECRWENNYCNTDFENCYRNENESECRQSGCEWSRSPRCTERVCNFDGQESCTAAGCVWDLSCTLPITCDSFSTQKVCETNSRFYCEWFGNECLPLSGVCYNYRTEASCEKASCFWVDLGQCYSGEKSHEARGCPQITGRDACSTTPGCQWQGNWCDVERPCQKYSNLRDECQSRSECSWQDEGIGGYNDPSQVPLRLWLLWIFANIVFIGVILCVIGYGTRLGRANLINIGIVFFSLDIITRYIGFIIDLWGYTSLSVVFVAGGIILLVAGYYLEKWRRSLILRAEGGTGRKRA